MKAILLNRAVEGNKLRLAQRIGPRKGRRELSLVLQALVAIAKEDHHVGGHALRRVQQESHCLITKLSLVINRHNARMPRSTFLTPCTIHPPRSITAIMGHGEATAGSVVLAGLLSPFLVLPYTNPRLQEASLRCVARRPRKSSGGLALHGEPRYRVGLGLELPIVRLPDPPMHGFLHGLP